MRPVRTIAGNREWDFQPDPRAEQPDHFQVIASVRLIDELSGLPPPQRPVVTSWPDGLGSSASASGLVGLTGRPRALYPDPWPAVPTEVEFAVSVPGYLRLALAGALPAQPGFPSTFVPLDLGTVGLHRQPTMLEGAVVSASGNPVVGADVAVTLGWRQTDDLAAAAGQAVNGITLAQPLAIDRPAGTSIRALALAPAGPAKSLRRPVSPGANRAQLSNRAAIAVGDVLMIGSDPERREYLTIFAIDTVFSADQPAFVTFNHPLAGTYPEGTVVTPVGLGAAGPVNQLDVAARAGDTTLLLDGLAGFNGPPGQLVISGGGAPDEHRDYARWTAVTGPQGDWRLPPIHRLAHLELTASGGGQPAPTRRIVTLTGFPTAFIDMAFT